jgi:hypothetical protein
MSNDEYKNGYRDGFKDGYSAGFHAARDNDSLMSPNIPIPTITTNCKVCGINIGSGSIGYVCTYLTCPTQSRGVSYSHDDFLKNTVPVTNKG